MRNQLLLGVSALLAAIFSCASAAAWELKPSRLETLAARYDLCDAVCIAMADGSLSAWERVEILADAKQILEPMEYQSFKRALDRISPPPKQPATKHSIKTVLKSPAPKLLPKPRPQAEPKPSTKAPPQAEPESGPVIPASAILPDRMASVGSLR